MTRMHNPPHPGEVLKEYLGDVSITDAAKTLGVGRVTLSRVVTGASGVSPDMAYRLGAAFGTSPELWAGMLRPEWRHLWIVGTTQPRYGLGGLVSPFIGIKLIDMGLTAIGVK